MQTHPPAQGRLESADIYGVEVERRGAVLDVTLARPARRNALDPRMIESLEVVLAGAAVDDSLRAILLTGRGTSFCSGFDLAEIVSLGTPTAGAEVRLVERLAAAICALPLPVVAAVNGTAAGAGCDVALACDVLIGHAGSVFVVPSVKTGLLYGPSSTRRLVAAFGPSVASVMLLTGTPVDAYRALQLGVLWSVVDEGDLTSRSRDLADMITLNAPLSLAAMKRSMQIVTDSRIPDEEVAELRDLEGRVWGSRDASDGVRAHLQKRAPEFRGE